MNLGNLDTLFMLLVVGAGILIPLLRRKSADPQARQPPHARPGPLPPGPAGRPTPKQLESRLKRYLEGMQRRLQDGDLSEPRRGPPAASPAAAVPPPPQEPRRRPAQTPARADQRQEERPGRSAPSGTLLDSGFDPARGAVGGPRPPALAASSGRGRLGRASRSGSRGDRSRGRAEKRGPVRSRAALRQAIIWREILDAPQALRDESQLPGKEPWT